MSAKLAFITGIAGFAGSHLAEELLSQGYKVAGSLFGNESTQNIDHIKKNLSLTRLDILDPKACHKVLKKYKPDYLFHLAAFASVRQSISKERLTYRINFDGTLNLLEAVRDLSNLKRFLFVSSCDTYGSSKASGKIRTEDDPLNPISPYGISKAYAEKACLFHFNQYGLPVVIARAFNHSGPRQDENYVIPSFARQIASIEKGLQKPELSVGDLSAKRDLSDVRDIVSGYRLIVEKGKPGRIYQLSSGRARSIKSVLNSLLRLSSAKIKVKIDRNRLRKNDIPILRGDNKRAVQELGYCTRYKFNVTLKDTLNYWRG